MRSGTRSLAVSIVSTMRTRPSAAARVDGAHAPLDRARQRRAAGIVGMLAEHFDSSGHEERACVRAATVQRRPASPGRREGALAEQQVCGAHAQPGQHVRGRVAHSTTSRPRSRDSSAAMSPRFERSSTGSSDGKTRTRTPESTSACIASGSSSSPRGESGSRATTALRVGRHDPAVHAHVHVVAERGQRRRIRLFDDALEPSVPGDDDRELLDALGGDQAVREQARAAERGDCRAAVLDERTAGRDGIEVVSVDDEHGILADECAGREHRIRRAARRLAGSRTRCRDGASAAARNSRARPRCDGPMTMHAREMPLSARLWSR